MINTPQRIEVFALDWPEVVPDADLAALLAQSTTLCDGDAVLVTSKVVSKAERRAIFGDRRVSIARESRRVLARRGDAVIAQTRHGLVMAAAGVDASNVPAGTALTLPLNPDESARRLRQRVHELSGTNIAVIITDTAGRAWRLGQTDMAIGCAGVFPLIDLHGSYDTHGNELFVTAPAIADELAAAGDLVKGKTSNRPVAVVRGLVGWVLPVDDHGPGAQALIRKSGDDLFGLGAREAALTAATRDDQVALAHFASRIPADPDPFEQLLTSHPAVRLTVARGGPGDGRTTTWRVRIDVQADAADDALIEVGRLLERAHVLATAYRLDPGNTISPDDCSPGAQSGWRTAASAGWTHRSAGSS
ncbi:MAG: coenzyme F420-0:L-glutamate ligase [Nocardioidaceae bacterium]